MRREEIEKIMEEAGKKGRRNNPFDIDKLRQILNILFLIGGLVGVLLYFFYDGFVGFVVIGIAMLIKLIDYLLRFLF